MSLLSSLLLLIVVARLFGRLFARYNQPELIGEILAGVLLGPAILGLIEPNKALAGVTELAVFLIILNAGLEMRFSDIVGAMKGRGLMLAAISFFIPFGGGVLVAAAFEQDIMPRTRQWSVTPTTWRKLMQGELKTLLHQKLQSTITNYPLTRSCAMWSLP